MTNKLDESIIFLNNLLIDKDLTFEFLEGVTVPLEETCIAIANSLKKYGRPDDEQLKGLFCLCYYQDLIQPEKIDVSSINDFLGEDLVDDLEIFRLFALGLQGVYSLSQSRLIEDEDKIPFFWLFYAVDEVMFKNQISHDFLGFILNPKPCLILVQTKAAPRGANNSDYPRSWRASATKRPPGRPQDCSKTAPRPLDHAKTAPRSPKDDPKTAQDLLERPKRQKATSVRAARGPKTRKNTTIFEMSIFGARRVRG